MLNKLHVVADYEDRSAKSQILILTVDFVDPLCYTTPNKPHRNGKNQVSPKGCHHPYQIQELEQSSENFVKNAHICSKTLMSERI